MATEITPVPDVAAQSHVISDIHQHVLQLQEQVSLARIAAQTFDVLHNPQNDASATILGRQLVQSSHRLLSRNSGDPTGLLLQMGMALVARCYSTGCMPGHSGLDLLEEVWPAVVVPPRATERSSYRGYEQ